MLSNTPHSNRPSRPNATESRNQDLDQNGRTGIGNTRSKCQTVSPYTKLHEANPPENSFNHYKEIRNENSKYLLATAKARTISKYIASITPPPEFAIPKIGDLAEGLIDVNLDYGRLVPKPTDTSNWRIPLTKVAAIRNRLFKEGESVIEANPRGYKLDAVGQKYADIEIKGLLGVGGSIRVRLLKLHWQSDFQETDRPADAAWLLGQWTPGNDSLLDGYEADYIQIETSGDYSERFTLEENFALVRDLRNDFGLRHTRLDSKADVYGEKVPITEMFGSQRLRSCTPACTKVVLPNSRVGLEASGVILAHGLY